MANRDVEHVLDTVARYFVGQRRILEKVLAGALANGHILFEDNPGLGKTLLVKVFSKALGLESRRIQFTPDMLPADIMGSKVWNPATRQFELFKGPIFTSLVLADEINRAPPKTQSALLEAMEERQVTIEGQTIPIPPPFIVLATQNPIEQEGTYPLPEAQMDRFLLRLSTGYPGDLAAEREILRRRIAWQAEDPSKTVPACCDAKTFRAWQATVEKDIFVHDAMLEYMAALVRKVREHPKVEVGPSPRGSLALLRVSRALAFVRGRGYVTPDDAVDVAVDVLAHRTIVEVDQALEGVTGARVVAEVVKALAPPRAALPPVR
ncbi:MAG TPA: MoxR family ATPase [Candidatus Thermoplasmatota archaeon]|nr:MoxR family ATPase [Candidatus Thermoplasmatota archaeon]